MNIPRVCHHVWLGKSEVPPKFRTWRQRFIDMNPGWTFRLWTDDNLPPIMNQEAWQASLQIGGTPGCVLRSDILRLEVLARFGGVYLDTDIKPVQTLDSFCDVPAWVACEQRDIISNAAIGLPRNHPAAWHTVIAIRDSFFKQRYVGNQAGPGLVRQIFPLYDDIVLYPPAYFHPSVGEVFRNPEARPLLKAAHIFSGTWLDENKVKYAGMWAANASATAHSP